MWVKNFLESKQGIAGSSRLCRQRGQSGVCRDPGSCKASIPSLGITSKVTVLDLALLSQALEQGMLSSCWHYGVLPES